MKISIGVYQGGIATICGKSNIDDLSLVFANEVYSGSSPNKRQLARDILRELLQYPNEMSSLGGKENYRVFSENTPATAGYVSEVHQRACHLFAAFKLRFKAQIPAVLPDGNYTIEHATVVMITI